MAAERGTWAWLRWRFSTWVVHQRLPNFAAFKEIIFFITSWPYRGYLKFLMMRNLRRAGKVVCASVRKCLYASPVGTAGKPFLEKVILKFGHESFDYLIFAWDGTDFSEDVFKKCRIIREPGLKWYFMKKYLTPELCGQYDYIFPWDDDIDVDGFSVDHFLGVMDENLLEVAQPSLTPDSFHNHGMMLRREGRVGRYTDFVEIMVPVFRKDAWIKYWKMLELDWNYWGWGYDDMANSLCDYRFTGIVDCESVRHTKVCREDPGAMLECDLFVAKHKRAWRALKVSYANLRGPS